VRADSYREAELKLKTQMPHQAGFLQVIKSKEIQKLRNKSYQKEIRLSKVLKANVDLWLKYSCKHKGEFYITAYIPKENVHYLNFNLPSSLTLAKIKRKCGNKKVFIVYTDANYSYYDDNGAHVVQASRKPKFNIICGDVFIPLRSNTWAEYHNKFDNFRAMDLRGPGYTYGPRDISLELWLELTKNF
jgi:hypothetical protein